jgi:uncharacterized protein YbaP (TraB family)
MAKAVHNFFFKKGPIMKRISCVLSPLFLLLWMAAVPEGEVFSQQGKSFLWKVQSEASTVYILGSIHFLKKEDYPLGQRIERSFEQSDFLVVEANIQDPAKMNLQSIMEKAFYPPEEKIEEHISQETYELLKGEADRLGVPLQFFQKQRPWFLSMALTAMELMKLGYDPSYGVDNYFLSKARGMKKILELESLDEQFQLLSNLSDQDQDLLLALSLKDIQNTAREINKLVQAWKAGQPNGVAPIMMESLKQEPKLASIYEKLLDERNGRMTSKIEGYLKGKGTYFVIVGAGHLVGEKGIIGMLGKKGFRVDQL